MIGVDYMVERGLTDSLVDKGILSAQEIEMIKGDNEGADIYRGVNRVSDLVFEKKVKKQREKLTSLGVIYRYE